MASRGSAGTPIGLQVHPVEPLTPGMPPRGLLERSPWPAQLVADRGGCDKFSWEDRILECSVCELGVPPAMIPVVKMYSFIIIRVGNYLYNCTPV